jgi:predicted permease
MAKLLSSLGVIIIGLALGYVIQILVNKNILQFPFGIETLRKTQQRIAFLVFEPIVTMGAIWMLDLKDFKIFAFPFIGIFALLLGGVVAFAFARMLKMSRKQTGVFIISGGFSNLGSIGGLICFTFLGEPGFALVSFYRLFEMFSYYVIGFPIARSYSENAGESAGFHEHIKRIVMDPFVLVATGSLLAGLVLNLSGVKRPDFYSGINAVLIPSTAILLLSSIGMALRFNHIGKHIKEGLLIALIKFVIVPITVTMIAYFLGFGKIDQGLPLKVVLILSSMPVAFTAMVPPTIYHLDIDLANATWLVTNGLLLLVMPVLQLLLSLF